MKAYTLKVVGPDGDIWGALEIECAADDEAVTVALGAASSFGHELWRSGAFLGWFSGQLSEAELD